MSSEFSIITSETFVKSVSKLSKKYPSLASDLIKLKQTLLKDPFSGAPLGNKVRMQISSKNTGKSSGARVITYVRIQMHRITLLDIYDKSEKEDITDKELAALIKKAE